MGNTVQDAIAAARAAAEATTGQAIPEPTVPDVQALAAKSQSGTGI